MTTPFTIRVTAAQVGRYFVNQYYHVLQEQPYLVHQFYSNASTMLRIDGSTRETATTMLQIHTLVMSLDLFGIEIKTAHSLESWNGGVLVMVSGSLRTKDLSDRRKFVQTFFLAPQEKGYFVLNDLFHFVDEATVQHHPAALLAQNNVDPKLSSVTAIPEQASNYFLSGNIQGRDFMAPVDVEENGFLQDYSFQEQQLQKAPEPESILEANQGLDSNGTVETAIGAGPEHLPASVEEPVGETQRQTYASILRVAKEQSTPSVATQPPANWSTPSASDWNHTPLPTSQLPISSVDAAERSGADALEDVSPVDDEGEIKSVYVRNLPPTVLESEIEEEFKKFGEISPDGVVIRSRKDVGVCYAFVEFEDMLGVYNAVQAGSAFVAGRPVYIEERRPNSNIPPRGARRGRGRGSYQTEAPRGRFVARNYGRGAGVDGAERENRPRGNGFYRSAPRQDRGLMNQQVLRSGQSS